MENKHNLVEDESISDSIDDSSTYDESDDGYISTNNAKDIQDGNYVHTEINAIDARLIICDRIRLVQIEWKGEETSAKTLCKGFHKFFKCFIKKLQN